MRRLKFKMVPELSQFNYHIINFADKLLRCIGMTLMQSDFPRAISDFNKDTWGNTFCVFNITIIANNTSGGRRILRIEPSFRLVMCRSFHINLLSQKNLLRIATRTHLYDLRHFHRYGIFSRNAQTFDILLPSAPQ